MNRSKTSLFLESTTMMCTILWSRILWNTTIKPGGNHVRINLTSSYQFSSILFVAIMTSLLSKALKRTSCEQHTSGSHFETPKEIICTLPQNTVVKTVMAKIWTPNVQPGKTTAHKCMYSSEPYHLYQCGIPRFQGNRKRRGNIKIVKDEETHALIQ